MLLLEGLVEENLNFVFKGGTALMLLLETSRRLSIDIDIIVPDKTKDLRVFLQNICNTKGFSRFEEQHRKVINKIEKEHYKFFYTSNRTGEEWFILLDVLREDVNYVNLIEVEIDSPFTEMEGKPLKVKVPNLNNILGDKLTAFAPHTTGIPYVKGRFSMSMEIIKQLYDVGCIFPNVTDLEEVSKVFFEFAKTEISYRENICTVEDVMFDIYNHCLSLTLRKDLGKACFNVLQDGINRIKPFIFSENYHLEKSFISAARCAYIITLIRLNEYNFQVYDYSFDIKDWKIIYLDSKLNKLKKSNPEAFYYWCLVDGLQEG